MCSSSSSPDLPATDVEASAVRAIWEPLGLPGIVDVHTHFMPDNVLEKVWAYFAAAGPMIGREWHITYRTAEDDRVARLRAMGVLAFTSMVYPHKPGMAEWLNGWSADFAARHPDCLHTATFFPEPDAGRYVDAALDAGARAFKSHVQVGDYSPVDPLLDPVWGALRDAGVPTVIHCGGGPVPGRFTGPGPIADLLERFPGLPLIVAHLGMGEYREFLDLAGRHESMYLDTTMAWTDFVEEQLPFPPQLRSRLADLRERILLGTDFPNIPYPYPHQLEAAARVAPDDDWLRSVLHGNAVRLFRLGG